MKPRLLKPHHKRRLYFIFLLLAGISSAVAFSLFALRKNINLYFTPSELYLQPSERVRFVRLGGLVVNGSVRHDPNSLKVTFVLTDYHHKMMVKYEDILPSLFREGQGIVAKGYLNAQGVFIADQVLAKHDANYHPPKIPDKATL